MRTKIANAYVLLLLMCIAESADAIAVLDTTATAGGRVGLISFGEIQQDPLGQSFTTTQSLESLFIGGALSDFNPGIASSLDITISLVDGAGVGGTIIGSSSFTLATGFNGIHVEDFSGIGTIGPGTYTVVFSGGGSGRAALGVTAFDSNDPTSDWYGPGGIFEFPALFDEIRDFRVIVTADAVSTVPLPTAIMLFGAGIAGLSLSIRKAK